MSRKLATTIKDSEIPGKYKRVAEAYAAFANNDGSNIFPSQEKLAGKAGVSPDTIQRNTPDLVYSGLLKHAVSHTCKHPHCNKGATHYGGAQGKWTLVYNLDISCLQSAVKYLAAICSKVNAAKCRKAKAANCGTTQALKETPAALGKDQDSSAVPLDSKKARKQVTLATTSLASPASDPASQASQSQPLSGSGVVLSSEEQNQSQKQNQEQPQPLSPQTFQELADSDQFFAEPSDLLWRITPNITDAMVKEQLPLCARILTFFEDADEYKVQAAELVLKFNRAHRSGKYATKDDKKLFIRTAAQYLKALESENAHLLNDYASHDFKHCEVCREAQVFDYKAFVRSVREEERKEAEHKRQKAKADAELAKRRAEEERIAKLCPKCKKRDPGKHMAYLGGGAGWKLVCDPCYDDSYEFQQAQLDKGFGLPRGIKAIEPRPEYAEAKRKAEAAALAKKIEDAECDVPICLECGQVTFHAKSCSKNPNKHYQQVAADQAKAAAAPQQEEA